MEIKYLELEEAVVESAKQNFAHDVARALEEESSWEEQKDMYLEEARAVLLMEGHQNYVPDLPNMPLIKLKV